ncbi:uncharacterized protein LOC131006496 [Salvia miltiorrhiza]|uniref:uncharacterized protein LOC131006496 n=1 Tax=Salvia miltiorrhiza TaxID=226208 RepID=UPI0025AC4934|nr:uncharacterized protein LOC131006496 [Salvia miltiorrhiza]
MAPVFGLIKDLEVGKSKFTLQLRLVRSYEVPQFHNINEIGTLECVFHDKEGSRIHATIQNLQIENFKNLLHEGNVYAVMKYIVGNNNMRTKTTTNRLKILIYKDTRIAELVDDGFPTHVLNLKSFEEIESMKTTPDFQDAPLFDVMGIIISCYKPVEKVINGKPTKLMDIMIEDLEYINYYYFLVALYFLSLLTSIFFI